MGKPNSNTINLNEAQVYNMLGYGKSSAITGQQIADSTGLVVREVRAVMEQLRREHIIVNDQDGTGYYLSNEPQEAQRYYWQEYSRAISILRRLKPVREFLKANGVDMVAREQEAKQKAM